MTNDWGLILAAVIGAAPATIGSILAWQNARRAHTAAAESKDAIVEMRVAVDGRLTQLLEQTTIAQHAAGVAAGRAQEHDEQTQRAAAHDNGGS